MVGFVKVDLFDTSWDSTEESHTEKCVTGETVRTALERMGVRWLWAKRWVRSPNPDEYAREKGGASGRWASRSATPVGWSASRKRPGRVGSGPPLAARLDRGRGAFSPRAVVGV